MKHPEIRERIYLTGAAAKSVREKAGTELEEAFESFESASKNTKRRVVSCASDRAKYRKLYVETCAVHTKSGYGPTLNSPDAVYEALELVAPQLFSAPVEYLLGLFLDNRTRLLALYEVKGGWGFTPLEPGPLIQAALLVSTRGVLLVHSHPSGNVTPSTDDHEVTKRVRSSLDAVGIRLLDHLVVGRRLNDRPNFFSFASSGTM